jgi:hypothetical protein
MLSFSARLLLIVSVFAAALAVILGHSAMELTHGRVTADNGWSVPTPAPTPATPDDNGWS